MRKLIRGHRESFTMIEMLVVIVIIVILVVLLMPSLGKSREHARMARCKNNLKNLHTAVMNYSYEHNAYMPNSQSTEDWWSQRSGNKWQEDQIGWVHWTDYQPHDSASDDGKPGYTRWWGRDGIESIQKGSLWEFGGRNMKVYLCPTFSRKEYRGLRDPENGSQLEFDEDTHPVVRSYAMNSRIDEWKLGLGWDQDKKSTPEYIGSYVAVESSRTLLFADMAHTRELGTTTIADRCMMEDSGASGNEQRRERHDLWAGSLEGSTNSIGFHDETIGIHHNGKGLVIFIDGHVEALTWQDTNKAWEGAW